jgi:hypothetical protein
LNGGTDEEKKRGGPEFGWRHESGEVGGDGDDMVIAAWAKQYITI